MQGSPSPYSSLTQPHPLHPNPFPYPPSPLNTLTHALSPLKATFTSHSVPFPHPFPFFMVLLFQRFPQPQGGDGVKLVRGLGEA